MLCALALSLTNCQLYVSSRELDGDGGTISDGSSDGGAATGCRHPEESVCGYRFKRELTFNAQPLQEVLVDFPVLVTLDDTRIDYGQTQPGGADLRFVDEDGTLLAHEIEQWRSGGVSSIWVRIPRFDPRTRKTITYFYGSDTARALNRGPQVFSADYEAVYHLSDALLANRVLRDARELHNGKPSNNVNASSSVAGVIGSGLQLSAGRFVELPDLEDSNLTALTIEFWLRQPMPRSHERVLCREDAEGPVACLGVHNGELEFTLKTQGTAATSITEVADETVGTRWTHVAMIWDAATENLRILRNGVQTSSSYRVSGTALATSRLPWLLGDPSGQGFSGEIDELRIAHVARSNTWLLATVAIVSEPLPIKNYGDEQRLR